MGAAAAPSTHTSHPQVYQHIPPYQYLYPPHNSVTLNMPMSYMRHLHMPMRMGPSCPSHYMVHPGPTHYPAPMMQQQPCGGGHGPVSMSFAGPPMRGYEMMPHMPTGMPVTVSRSNSDDSKEKFEHSRVQGMQPVTPPTNNPGVAKKSSSSKRKKSLLSKEQTAVAAILSLRTSSSEEESCDDASAASMAIFQGATQFSPSIESITAV
jgi:hypothetical protein